MLTQKEEDLVAAEVSKEETLEKAECCCCIQLELGMKVLAGLSILFYFGDVVNIATNLAKFNKLMSTAAMTLFIVVGVLTLGSMYFWIRPLIDWEKGSHKINLRYGMYATMVLIVLCTAMGCVVAPDYITDAVKVPTLLNKTAHFFDHQSKNITKFHTKFKKVAAGAAATTAVPATVAVAASAKDVATAKALLKDAHALAKTAATATPTVAVTTQPDDDKTIEFAGDDLLQEKVPEIGMEDGDELQLDHPVDQELTLDHTLGENDEIQIEHNGDQDMTLELDPTQEGEYLEITVESNNLKKEWSEAKKIVVQSVWISCIVSGVVGLAISYYFLTEINRYLELKGDPVEEIQTDADEEAQRDLLNE